MKQLILVRHAKTEHTFGVNDFERKLTNRGHNDAKIVVEQLILKNILPDYFISSKAKRALQTAKIFAMVLDFSKNNINTQQFLYDGYTTTDFLNYISSVDDKYNSIIVFAHNPDIVMLASRISDEDIYHFPTTATVVIDFDTDAWEKINPREGKTHLFIYPSMLKE